MDLMTDLVPDDDKLGIAMAALAQILLGEGRYSRDPLEHASNTIEDMQAIAREAIRRIG